MEYVLQYVFRSTDLPNGKTNIGEIFTEQKDDFGMSALHRWISGNRTFIVFRSLRFF